VEDGTLILIGATTENPFFEVNAPLRSRSTLFRLEPLDATAVETLIARGLDAERSTADPDAVELLVERAAGDGRQALTSLEVACALAEDDHVRLPDVEAALGTSALRYGRDDHYDVVSAFIKSLRGSDPDAAIYWLARMLEAGEDARFIARRLVIFASEDVGLADSSSLGIAVAAAHAVEHVGLPEAQLNLAHAAVHLAAAPKSNRAAVAIWNARGAVRDGLVGEVPAHLRDAHYHGASTLGHGAGYEYPHDHAAGWVDQQYLPDMAVGRRWYEPGSHGEEGDVASRLARRSRRGTGDGTE
jgi:putative ATPase